MPPRLNAARKAANGSILSFNRLPSASAPAAVAAIWITDDDLSRAYLRFCASHFRPSRSENAFDARREQCLGRRHASNVPGPLESQKRLSRRKMNNLSIGRAVDLSPDPMQEMKSWLASLLRSGRNAMSWTWMPPEKPAAHDAPQDRDLPGWATQPAGMVPWTISRRIGIGIAKAPSRTEFDGVSVEKYQHLLATANSLEDMRRLHQNLRGMPLDPGPCSELAFRKLLEKDAAFADLIEFLDDPLLNHANVKNVQALVGMAKVGDLSAKQSLWVHAKVQELVDSGGIPLKEGMALVTESMTVVQDCCRKVKDMNLEKTKSLWATTLTTGVYSPVIERFIIPRLLDFPGNGTATALMRETMMFLLSLNQSSFNFVSTDCLSSAIKFFLDTRTQATLAATQNGDTAQSVIVQLLDALPQPFALRYIVASAQRIAQDVGRLSWKTNDKVAQVSILDEFLIAIRRCRHVGATPNDPAWDTIHSSMARFVSPKVIPTHFASMSERDQRSNMAKHWIAPWWTAEAPHDSVNINSWVSRVEAPLASSKGPAANWMSLLFQLSARPGAPLDKGVRSVLELLLGQRDYDSFYLVAMRARRFLHLSASDPTRRLLQHYMELVASPPSPRADLILLAFRLYKIYPIVMPAGVPRLLAALCARPALLRPADLWAAVQRDRWATTSPPHRGVGPLRIPHALPPLYQAVALATAQHPRADLRKAGNAVRRVEGMLGRAAGQPPLTCALSRAALLAMVLRPMREGTRVGEESYRWVIGLVARIDGEEFAAEVDRVVFMERAVMFERGGWDARGGEGAWAAVNEMYVKRYGERYGLQLLAETEQDAPPLPVGDEDGEMEAELMGEEGGDETGEYIQEQGPVQEEYVMQPPG